LNIFGLNIFGILLTSTSFNMAFWKISPNIFIRTPVFELTARVPKRSMFGRCNPGLEYTTNPALNEKAAATNESAAAKYAKRESMVARISDCDLNTVIKKDIYRHDFGVTCNAPGK
jgi:hypothetical protein